MDYDADERVSKWFNPVATDGSAVERVAAQVRREAPNTLSELQKTLAEPEPFTAQAKAEPKPQEPSVPEIKAPAKEPTKAPKARTRKKTTKK